MSGSHCMLINRTHLRKYSINNFFQTTHNYIKETGHLSCHLKKTELADIIYNQLYNQSTLQSIKKNIRLLNLSNYKLFEQIMNV